MFDEDTERIVMDKDNHPLVDYEDIPLVLSSNFGLHEEGYLLEAIRRIDMRIERTDFLARMVGTSFVPSQHRTYLRKPDIIVNVLTSNVQAVGKKVKGIWKCAPNLYTECHWQSRIPMAKGQCHCRLDAAKWQHEY